MHAKYINLYLKYVRKRKYVHISSDCIVNTLAYVHYGWLSVDHFNWIKSFDTMIGQNVTNCISIEYFLRFYNDKRDKCTNNKTKHFLHSNIFELKCGRNNKNQKISHILMILLALRTEMDANKKMHYRCVIHVLWWCNKRLWLWIKWENTPKFEFKSSAQMQWHIKMLRKFTKIFLI